MTLTEAEVGQLRRIAGRTAPEVEGLLLSVDRFVNSMPELGLTSLERKRLLDRFGVFGVRKCSTLLRQQVVGTASDLARELVTLSGLDELRSVLRSLFYERRDVLKSRSALLALDSVLRSQPRAGSRAVAAEVEEIVASAHPFHELRVLSAIRAGGVQGKSEVITELEHLIGGAGTAATLRLRLPPDARPSEITAAASAALLRWQRRAENPLTRHEMSMAARVAIRSCEGIMAAQEARR